MRSSILRAVVCAMLLGTAAYAQTPDPQVTAPIQKFIDAFNKGDIAGASATHAKEADLVILDEVAPYVWTGPQAFDKWLGDLGSESKKNGITDQKVTIGAPTRVETNGAAAYVIVPTVYTFKQKGVSMRERAQMTFALRKGASGWMIHAWTWTGPKAQKAS
jgi:SnoaL-like protein